MTEMRIGDADREAAVSALGEHYVAGRLTKEEYDERVDLAWAARTGSALHPLFLDLPRPVVARPAPAAPTRGTSYRGTPYRGRPGRPLGGWLIPLLVAVAVLVVLTHLPVFLLLLAGWFLVTRMTGHRSRASWHGRDPSRRW